MEQKLNLQLFGEGDGGAAQPAADGARLRELGVPESVLSRRGIAAAVQEKGEPVQTSEAASKPVTVARQGVDVRSHYDSLYRQGQEMAGRYAGFDLQKELDNPVFFKLTGPEVGLSVEDAYMAVHHRELTRAIAEGTKRELSNAIRAGAARPGEHGIGGSAATVTGFDYRNADRSQRRAFKQQILNAAARGEKIYPSR